MSEPLKNTHLAELHTAREAVVDATNAIRDGLSPAQLTWQPPDGGWSMASCFEHLAITAELYFDRLDAAMQRTRDKGYTDEKPYRPTWVGGMLINAVIGKKASAPKVFRPRADGAQAAAIDRFLQAHDEILRRIRDADGCDLNRVKLGMNQAARHRCASWSA